MVLAIGSPAQDGGLVTYPFTTQTRHAITYPEKDSNMPRKKIAQANTESPRVAHKPAHFYYEYIDSEGRVIYLDQYEWSSGMGLSHKEVKKAQAARKREVKKGLADTKEA